jgi:hypothetical protein
MDDCESMPFILKLGGAVTENTADIVDVLIFKMTKNLQYGCMLQKQPSFSA